MVWGCWIEEEEEREKCVVGVVYSLSQREERREKRDLYLFIYFKNIFIYLCACKRGTTTPAYEMEGQKGYK